MAKPDALAAELERRVAVEAAARGASAAAAPSRIPGVVAIIAALGGPALITTVIAPALASMRERAAAETANAVAQAAEQKALKARVDVVEKACADAAVTATDAKSQAVAAGVLAASAVKARARRAP